MSLACRVVSLLGWSAAVLLLIADSAAVEVKVESGSQLAYRGTLVPADPNAANNQEKSFDVIYLASLSDKGTTFHWTVAERGRGQWPWSERFGAIAFAGARASGLPPAVIYEREDGRSIVPLEPPVLLHDKPLAAGATWTTDRLEYRVEEETTQEGVACWRIAVRSATGHKRTLWTAKDTGLVIAYDERVFMGMGTPYTLRLRLASHEKLAERDHLAATAGFEALHKLRGELATPSRSAEVAWSKDQLAKLQVALPALAKSLSGPAAKIVRAGLDDLGAQANRAAGVADLQKQFVGQAVKEFQIAGLAGAKLSQTDLKDAVTVLHFWEYRDTPLKEPYGQVGYLEFLHTHRQKDKVRVYGVAVDGRLQDPDQRRAAEQGVRKLKSFMNLSYPILLDGGDLLKQFGDPRILGAELPLYVVIGPNGKITHYHAGLYEVDRREGLKELDEAVTAARK